SGTPDAICSKPACQLDAHARSSLLGRNSYSRNPLATRKDARPGSIAIPPGHARPADDEGWLQNYIQRAVVQAPRGNQGDAGILLSRQRSSAAGQCGRKGSKLAGDSGWQV